MTSEKNANGVMDDLDETEVEDESDGEEATIPTRYKVSSFGADWEAEGVVRKLTKGKLFIPKFQRAYVWSLKEASKFIESLLLGLPVPGIFVAKEADTNKLLIIDGQQRCRSLQFFFEGTFDPRPGATRQRVFKLDGVVERFQGKTYKTLDEPDRIQLEECVIHATIVKQELPEEDDTSIYHIFERLNSGGRKLTPQEIRVAAYHGRLMNGLDRMNKEEAWRTVYGPTSKRLKDAELCLRYLALLIDLDSYDRPMKEFLNKFSLRHRELVHAEVREAIVRWPAITNLILGALGPKACRPIRSLNAALFDAVYVGVAMATAVDDSISEDQLRSVYGELLRDEQFIESFSRSTADTAFVKRRIEMFRDRLLEQR